MMKCLYWRIDMSDYHYCLRVAAIGCIIGIILITGIRFIDGDSHRLGTMQLGQFR